MILSSPPAFLEYIRTSIEYMPKNTHFTDDSSISKYLRELYFYEIKRSPQHPIFVESYRRNDFLNTEMLRYYIDPFNKLNLYIEYKLNQMTGNYLFFIEKRIEDIIEPVFETETNSSSLTAQS